MIKNISRLEAIIDGKVCHFTCDCDTSTVIVKEALFQFLKCIGQLEDAAAKAQQQKQDQKEEDNAEG